MRKCLTVFILNALAKCSAPLTPISFQARYSVVSVCIVQRESIASSNINVVSLYLISMSQLNIVLLQFLYHFVLDITLSVSAWDKNNKCTFSCSKHLIYRVRLQCICYMPCSFRTNSIRGKIEDCECLYGMKMMNIQLINNYRHCRTVFIRNVLAKYCAPIAPILFPCRYKLASVCSEEKRRISKERIVSRYCFSVYWPNVLLTKHWIPESLRQMLWFSVLNGDIKYVFDKQNKVNWLYLYASIELEPSVLHQLLPREEVLARLMSIIFKISLLHSKVYRWKKNEAIEYLPDTDDMS